MKINELNNYLDELFPYNDSEDWDYVGLYKKKFKNKNISKVLVSLDISIKCIEFAIKNNINLIISHHPIFINKKDKKKKEVIKINSLLNDNKISIISLHTNYDKNKIGMNYQLAKKMNGTNIKKVFDNSYGNIFNLPKELSENDLIKNIKISLNSNFVISDNSINEKKYKRIYICGGAGSNEIEKIILENKKIDCYISGEIKWNLWNEANLKNVKIFDVGHNIENIFVDHIIKELNKLKIPAFKFEKINLKMN